MGDKASLDQNLEIHEYSGMQKFLNGSELKNSEMVNIYNNKKIQNCSECKNGPEPK